MVLKEKIHQLVDACENDSALLEIEMILQQTSDEDDWWLQLPGAEKEKTFSSLAQLANGQKLSHGQVMERVEATFTK